MVSIILIATTGSTESFRAVNRVAHRRLILREFGDGIWKACRPKMDESSSVSNPRVVMQLARIISLTLNPELIIFDAVYHSIFIVFAS